MVTDFLTHLRQTLADIEAAGLYKQERVLATAQQARVATAEGRAVLNFCANNYLGLANHPQIIAAAHAALDRWGYGLSSVRFICGTQQIHRELEQRLSHFLGTEETILYSSCFDANGGVFETLLGAEDAVISDELNHASIIDGIRLCKAQRYRYRNNDMSDLAAKLREANAAGARFKLIATDGVFSMDGIIANLREICALADQHHALVLVDDSHAVGFMGRTGRGTPELCGVVERVDLLTGTLGKALGGASGGYVSGRKEAIDLLRQRSRPYLFSNSLAPAIVAASIAALDLLARSTELRDRLEANTAFFRAGLTQAGLAIKPGTHPIVPVMLGDAKRAQQFAARMLERGVYVVGFFYPVVPQGAARIRTQVSAAHTREDLEFAIDAFAATKHELGL
ncbi:glycine C-acetyltransferase [Opitutus terrae]|uniref:2-amino-3-ketobutyrate coenzyme A ligase n=1 Tax=Opitutus terrae (strain DSM 11246 / JCM 15787 / PB90-1) TaxID=452637 RepID=B1ZUW9_OPITP|nr:glycine C-acetyltransferase [Opitutus terrae]ACB75939.1 2-amino-3-ketobutyrate coenzyme A ligase [Opitutus terrae PB90-1]